MFTRTVEMVHQAIVSVLVHVIKLNMTISPNIVRTGCTARRQRDQWNPE